MSELYRVGKTLPDSCMCVGRKATVTEAIDVGPPCKVFGYVGHDRLGNTWELLFDSQVDVPEGSTFIEALRHFETQPRTKRSATCL